MASSNNPDAQGAGSTTPRNTSASHPWSTMDRSVIACLTKTMP